MYLGVLFSDSNRQQQEINRRINKYNTNLYLLYPILKDRNVPTKCKSIIYNTMISPILFYGSESWSLTKKTKSQIQAAQMRTLRLIRGVTRLDRMRNDDIREELGVDSVLELIEQNILRWYGHIKRMPEERFPRRSLDWTPQGRRPVGRPRKRWMDGVKSALLRRETTLDEVEGDELYLDRREWRSLTKRTPADRL